MPIYVDADACPVKEEIYRLARRRGVKVLVVSHGPLHVPPRVAGDGRVEAVRVARGFGAADDWIAERAGRDDIVVTADIPLAARCLANGARVLSPTGQPFAEDSIGDALATRELMDQLRQSGLPAGGPAPFSAADRSRFTSRLGEMIDSVMRKAPSGPPPDGQSPPRC